MKIGKSGSGSGGSVKSGVNILVGGSSSGSKTNSADSVGETSGITAVTNTFGAELNAAGRTYDIEEIKKMIGGLDRDAKDFEKNPTFAAFDRYKNKVQAILGEICRRLYNAKTVKNMKNTKEYTVIQKIEGEIAELEKAFNQKVKVDIISKNDEIKGLLLNITT